MLAGVAGGTAIAKGLGPAHAMANALGDRGFHHGMLCAIALPIAVEIVAPHVLEKMQLLAAVPGFRGSARVSDALRDLNSRLGIPASLQEAGFGDANIDELATDAAASPFNRSSPYVPTVGEYRKMFTAALRGDQK